MRYKNRTDRENLDADEARVSQLLGDLRRVEAPTDFDFKLRARIANASPARTRTARLLPVMKFAVPLCLLLFLTSGFLVLNGNFSTETASSAGDAPVIAGPVSRPVTTGNQQQSAAAVPEPLDAGVTPPQTSAVERAAVRPNRISRTRIRNVPQDLSGGGSLERDMSISHNTIRPPGTSKPESANTSSRQTDSGNSGKVGAAAVLSSVGVEAGFDAGELKVRSVRAGSAAENAGIKAGDIIKGIDEKNVSESSAFDTSSKARSLSLNREGKTIVVVLNDK